MDPNQEVSLGKAAAVGITAGVITTVSVASVGVFTATAVSAYAVTTTNVAVHGAVAVVGGTLAGETTALINTISNGPDAAFEDQRHPISELEQLTESETSSSTEVIEPDNN